jgi:hypothetical protein
MFLGVLSFHQGAFQRAAVKDQLGEAQQVSDVLTLTFSVGFLLL